MDLDSVKARCEWRKALGGRLLGVHPTLLAMEEDIEALVAEVERLVTRLRDAAVPNSRCCDHDWRDMANADRGGSIVNGSMCRRCGMLHSFVAAAATGAPALDGKEDDA